MVMILNIKVWVISGVLMEIMEILADFNMVRKLQRYCTSGHKKAWNSGADEDQVMQLGILEGKIHHFSCGCPIDVDGNCSQLKQ